VYALVADASPSTANDSFQESSDAFMIASSALKGDVSFGSFGAAAGSSAAQGGQSISGFGAMQLGATGNVSTSNASSAWWFQTPGGTFANTTFYVNSSGGTSASFVAGDIGSEVFLGTLDVSFSNYSLPAVTTTAPFDVIPTNKVGTSKPDAWKENSVTFTTFGTAGNIGGGPNSPNTLYPFPSLQFVFTTSTTSSGVIGNTTLSAISPAASPVFGGLSTTIGFTISNTGSATGQDTVNWSVNGAAKGTVGNTSGAGLAPSTSTPGSVSYTAPSNGFFGYDVVTLAATGSGPTGTATPSSGTTSVNVIAIGTKPSADGTGVFGTYGNVMSTGALSSGASLGGLATSLTSALTSGIGLTNAQILAGSLSASSTGITMAWRSRASNELPGSFAAGSYPLASDVVNLNGLGSSTYVLQMSFGSNTVATGGTTSIASLASGGYLFLAYNLQTSPGGLPAWTNAVNGNTGNPATPLATNYQGSYAQFIGSGGPGNGDTLAQQLGSWGINTANDTAWAVVNHDAEFAVVPEPGTLALLAAGLGALGFAYRRRKMNVASAA
jgi:hypothetical protein